ncbi:MAG: spore germination protein GerW family protein [Anaerolineales bacterium]|jgi:uncharacterized spore protein YtfJ
MSEESKLSPQDMSTNNSDVAIDTVQETMAKFLDAAHVDVVYGEPIEHGDTLIIPTAEVLSATGFGVGYGSGPITDEEGEIKNGGYGGGGGGGGGGRVLSRPVAVVVASPEGVQVQEVVDVTKIALAALTAAGFMIGMLMKMMRGPR